MNSIRIALTVVRILIHEFKLFLILQVDLGICMNLTVRNFKI